MYNLIVRLTHFAHLNKLHDLQNSRWMHIPFKFNILQIPYSMCAAPSQCIARRYFSPDSVHSFHSFGFSMGLCRASTN